MKLTPKPANADRRIRSEILSMCILRKFTQLSVTESYMNRIYLPYRLIQ